MGHLISEPKFKIPTPPPPLLISDNSLIVALCNTAIIPFIVVIVVADNDAFYTGFTCPPTIHFKLITKCLKCLLQSATVHFITKCNGLLLQNATAFLLQSTTSVIKMCDNFITKSDRYYKVWQNNVTLCLAMTTRPVSEPKYWILRQLPRYIAVNKSSPRELVS